MGEQYGEISGYTYDPENAMTGYGEIAPKENIGKREDRLVDFLQYGLPGVPGAMVDTFGTSLGILDEGDVQTFMSEQWPQIGDYYSRNKMLVQTIGDAAGLVIPGEAMLKLYQGAGRAAKAIAGTRESKLLDLIFSRTGRSEKLFAQIQARDKQLAQAFEYAPSTDKLRRSLSRQVAWTNATDVIKENVMFELGMYATMSNSQVLYPDSFSQGELFAMAAALPAVGAAFSFARTMRELRGSIQSSAPILQQEREAVGFIDPSAPSTPKNRPLHITATALSRNIAETEQRATHGGITSATVGEELELAQLRDKNLGKAVTVYDEQLQNDLGKLFRDNTIPEATVVKAATAGELATAVNAAKKDAYTFVGAVSLEGVPTTQEGFEAFMTRLDKPIQKVKKDIEKLQKDFSKIDIMRDSEAASKIQSDLLTKRAKLDELNTLQKYVIEPDGSVVPANLRKPIFQDREGFLSSPNILIERATQTENKTYKAFSSADPLFGTPKHLIGMTNDFNLIIPPKENTISNVNVSRILAGAQDLHNPEFFRHTLDDMAQDWGVFTPTHGTPIKNRGYEIFRTLPEEIQKEVRTWSTSSQRSKLREWQANDDPRFQQLRNAFEPMRKRLREIADADGTIPVWRGESLSGFNNPKNDLVSVTSSPKVAKMFERGAIGIHRVHVDDFVMPVSGHQAHMEQEFIIQGNKRRMQIGTHANVNSWEALTLPQRSVSFALAQRAVKEWTPGTKISLANGDNWIKYDAIVELYKIHGDKIWRDITLPTDVNTLEDIIYISTSKKYKEFVRLNQLAENRTILNLSDKQIINREDIRKMLNMPGTGYDRKHPMYDLFYTLYAQGETDLRRALGGTTEIIQRAAQEVQTFPRMEKFTKSDKPEDMIGGMLHYSEDRKPVFMIKRPVDEEALSRPYLEEAMALDRTRVLGEFANSRAMGANVVADIFDVLIEDPARLAASRDFAHMVEGTQRGGGTVFQKSYAIGENPTVSTMHQINLLTDQAGLDALEKIFEPHRSVYQLVKDPKPAGKAILTDTLRFTHAYHMGWDLPQKMDEIFFDLGNELTGFKLANTKSNRDRWSKMFGEEMPENALMPTGGTAFDPITSTAKQVDLAVTPEALQVIQSLASVDNTIIKNKNQIARIMGRNETRERPLHIPARKFANKEVVYLFDDAMNFIAPIAGRTAHEATELAEKEIAARGGHGKYLNALDMTKYHEVELDEAFKRMTDYSDPLLQTGPMTGKIGWIPDISVDAFNDLVKTQEKQILSLVRQTRSAFYDPQIQMARARLQTATPPSGKTGKSIWQMYVSEITGNPELNPNQWTGMAYNTAERLYNEGLQAAFDRVASTFSSAAGKRMKASRAENAVYKQLQDQLGEFNPFEDALAFAERTAKVKPAVDMRKDMAGLSGLTTLLTLRLLGSGHEYLTMFSLPATMPAVIAGMRMTAHEKALGEQGVKLWKARTASWSSPAMDDVAMWNPTKAMMHGTHMLFSKEGREVWREASAQGFMKQAVSEFVGTLTAPTEGYIKGLIGNKLKFATYMADKSEVVARGIAFMAGYAMARGPMQLEKGRISYAFAKRFADETIGDYSPHNKPRMFQGGPGMPLGLFMTFMWNYFQRIFGYVENSQNRALITQYATQAAVFGGQTVPGFQQFSDMFFTNWDGTSNPVDGLNSRLGPEATDWLLYGITSNLPKMFGLEDGIAMYSRGDVNPRTLPTLLNIQDTPVYGMFRDFTSALTKGFQSVRARGGFDSNQMAEIVQQYSTNRFLRNFATFSTGYVTDRSGQVIATSPTFKDILNGQVENEVALLARLVGMRGLNEAKTTEAYARNRFTDMSRRARNDQINDVVRSEFRKGKPDAEVMQHAITEHIRLGGSVDNIPNWLFEQILRSKVDKTSLDIIKYFSNPQKADQTLRLLNVLQSAPPNEIPSPLQ